MYVWAGRLFFAADCSAVFCFHLVPSCILPMYFLEPLGYFLVNVLLFIDHKKKKKKSKANKLTKADDGGQICIFASSDDNRNFL